MLYRVIVSGKIREGFHPAEVKRNIAAIFKTDISRAERLFTGGRVAVGREADHETALRRKVVLEGAGLVCSVEPVPVPAPVEKKPHPRAAGGNGGDALGSLHKPGTVVPAFGPASLFHSPMRCPRITGSRRGINLNRADAGEVLYGDIRLASVYSARENDRPVQRILLFPEGSERPFVTDASEVRYADFFGAGGGGAIESLRAFLAHLCEANPAMILDASSLDFLNGGRLPLLEKDEDTLSTALARALSPETDGQVPGGAGRADAEAWASGGRRAFRRARTGRPGERSALWDAGRRRGPLFAVLALSVLAVAVVFLIALPGGNNNMDVFADRDEFVRAHLRQACMAAMRLAIGSPEEAVTLERLKEGGYAVPEGLELAVLDGTWHSLSMSARHRKGGKTFAADKSCRVTVKTVE